MARIVKEYKRNSPQRKRKKLIVIGCEGETNKTEKSYFAGLERKINSCHFEFVEGKTDPLGIVKRIEAKAEELDKRDVNRYYAVFDVDNDINKKNKIENSVHNDTEFCTSRFTRNSLEFFVSLIFLMKKCQKPLLSVK